MNKTMIQKAAILLMAVFLMIFLMAGAAAAEEETVTGSSEADEGTYASCRLLVVAEDASVFPEDAPVLSSYQDTYLLQYETAEQTKDAYQYYLGHADVVDMDTVIEICEEEEEESAEEVFMTEESNPLTQLEAAVSETENAAYDIALIDTGAEEEHVKKAVSMIGDDSADHNGHGTRMASYIVKENEQVSIVSVKAIGDDGRGDVSAVYAAIEYAITQNVRVISLSASAAAPEHPILRDVIKKAVDQGIVFVGSAGNSGEEANNYIGWIAHWNDVNTYPYSYDMWQYSDAGSIPGISTRVDLNSYFR